MKRFHVPTDFQLESGEIIENLTIAFHTFGQLNSTKSNVVWICHALTANSDPTEWWPGIVGEKKLYDPNEYFIVCANIIGSAYGTTGPLTTQLNKRPLLDKFPLVTIKDMVRAHLLLKNQLGICKIHTLIGASVGGQQALEWAIEDTDAIENLVLIATNARHSAFGIAFNESQRLAIFADQTYGNGNITGGKAGLIAARSIALLSYRSYEGYNLSQTENSNEKTANFCSSSYQRYQGEKLAKRFNAYSYVALSKAMDSHNVARGRTSLFEALSRVKAKSLVIGITSDILFPLEEQQFLARHIPHAQLATITSKYGHDGFLLENKQLKACIEGFYAGQQQLLSNLN